MMVTKLPRFGAFPPLRRKYSVTNCVNSWLLRARNAITRYSTPLAVSVNSLATVGVFIFGRPFFVNGLLHFHSMSRCLPTPFPPTAVNPARRVFPRGDYLVTVDARRNAPRSVCRLGAVGGFFLHVGSVFFLAKKGITNGNENFAIVRNARQKGVLWTA